MGSGWKKLYVLHTVPFHIHSFYFHSPCINSTYFLKTKFCSQKFLISWVKPSPDVFFTLRNTETSKPVMFITIPWTSCSLRPPLNNGIWTETTLSILMRYKFYLDQYRITFFVLQCPFCCCSCLESYSARRCREEKLLDNTEIEFYKTTYYR